MAAEFDHTSVVIVGAWNPTIVSPQWLHKQGVVKRLPADPAELRLGFLPFARAIRFELGGMTWEVSDSRLVIRSDTMKNCGIYAAKVLKLLPHTPMQAIGTNFVFKAESKNLPAQDVPKLGSLPLPEGKGTVAFSQVSRQETADLDRQTVLNLTATRRAEATVISFNFHRNCEDTAKAIRFARLWLSDRRMVKSILRRKYKVDLQ